MDYKLMCFPCLRRKKKPSSRGSSSGESDENCEYIIDKYTIRKLPLHCQENNTEPRKPQNDNPDIQPYIFPPQKDLSDFIPAKQIPEMTYSVPRVTPVLPVTTHSSRSVKEKPRPADILDSTSSIPRRTIQKPNYVAIPSKASLHTKDIMLTKREITSQYLNNFSSVFVDNLKDQVPKDPEVLPKLSRPYTSAVKNMSVCANVPRSARRKLDSCKGKVQRLLYSFPDGTSKENVIDPEQVDNSNQSDEDDQVPVHSSRSRLEDCDAASDAAQEPGTDGPDESNAQPGSDAESDTSFRQITYEDIQALDVGYDFSNSEKYGVKPKRTRLNLDPDNKNENGAECDPSMKSVKTRSRSGSSRMSELRSDLDAEQRDAFEDQNMRFQFYLQNTKFMSLKPNVTLKLNLEDDNRSANTDASKLVTEDSQRTDSDLAGRGFQTRHCDADRMDTRPNSVSSERSAATSRLGCKAVNLNVPGSRSIATSRSLSLDSLSSIRKDERKIAKLVQALRMTEARRTEDIETETTNSLYSRESKTSSMATTALTSELDDRKKATLRWKIIIKHHKSGSREGQPNAPVGGIRK